MKINLQELSINNLSQWPLVIKMTSIIFLSFVVLIVAYWLMVKKDFIHYEQLKVQEGQLKKAFEFKCFNASNLRSYRSQVVVLNKRLKRMMRQLTAKNEMPALLQEITQIGIENGLTFELFAPMPEIAHDFYTELPVKIVVIGHYHQFAVFLSHIAAMKHMVTLHDFVMKKRTMDEQVMAEQEPIDDQLVMDITAKIYRYNKQS